MPNEEEDNVVPFDPQQFVENEQRRSVAAALSSFEDDPEKAARAQELADATGAHPVVVYSNMEKFEQQHKAALTGQLLRNNAYLSQFLNDQPLAPKITNDDLGQLDLVTQKMRQSGLIGAPSSIINEGIQGFVKGWHRDYSIGTGAMRQPGGMEAYDAGGIQRAGTAAWNILGVPFELLDRGMTGFLEGASAATKEAVLQSGGTEQQAISLARELTGMAEMELIGGGPHRATVAPEAIVTAAKEMIDKVRARHLMEYIRHGEEPPIGISPTYDLLKVMEAEKNLKDFKETEQEVNGAALKERSPKMLGEYLDQHTNGTIGISAQKIRMLYGEKDPLPDDGKLGWIPDLKERLSLLEANNGKINVPLSDWLSKMDPELAKEFEDFITVRKGGLSKEDIDFVKDSADQERIPVLETGHGPTDAIRASIHAEPLFDAERMQKLKLEPEDTSHLTDMEAALQPGRRFNLIDQGGKNIGSLSVYEDTINNHLDINWIGGRRPGEAVANAFGPRVIRDLLAQIKNEFPNVETIGGMRVSGARVEAGKGRGIAKISLRNPSPDMLENLAFHMNVVSSPIALVPPTANFAPHGFKTNRAEFVAIASFKAKDALDMVTPEYTTSSIGKELNKFFTKRLKELAGDVEVKIVGDAEFTEKRPTSAAFYDAVTHTVVMPARTIDGTSGREWTAHTLLHELTHAVTYRAIMADQLLHAQFTDLMNAADTWMAKNLPEQRKFHDYAFTHVGEFIAEAWSNQDLQTTLSHVPLPNEFAQFYKMKGGVKNVWDAIREVIASILERIIGSRPTPTVLDAVLHASQGFEQLHAAFPEFKEPGVKGKVKEAGFKISAEEAAQQKKLEGPVTDVAKTPGTFGLSPQTYRRYNLRMNEQLKAEHAAEQERITKEEIKRQSKEWKDNAAAMRKDVEQDIYNRPDIAANEWFRTGTLFGQTGRPPKIDPRYLTPEQRKGLPVDYVRRDTRNPDDLAGALGFHSGTAMIDRLVMLNQMQKDLNKYGKHFINYMVDKETERRMQEKYGSLAGNVFQEIQDRQFRSSLDSVHEDILALAERAGVKPEAGAKLPFERDKVKSWITEEFNKIHVGDIDSKTFMQEANRSGKVVEDLLLKGDFVGAFKEKQAQFTAITKAQLAVKAEKNVLSKVDSIAETYSKRGSPGKLVSGTAQEYTNFIHDILLRIGKPVARTPADLATEIARSGYEDLRDFVNSRFNSRMGMDDMPIPDFLMSVGADGQKWSKPVEKMTFEELKQVHMALTALSKMGKAELKVTTQQASIARQDLLDQMKDKVRTFSLKPQAVATPTLMQKTLQLPKTFLAASTNLETLMNRFDRDDPRGVFNRFVVYPLAGAANEKAKIQREYAKIYREIGELKDQNKLVDSPFIDPLSIDEKTNPTGTPMRNFTVGNVMVMIHNAGNESNWNVLARGYGRDPEGLKQWLFQNSTKEMWDRAEKMGAMFKKAFEGAQREYAKVYGVAPEKIELKPFTVTFKDGTQKEYDGWYHPLIKHPKVEAYIDAEGNKISGQSVRQKGGSVYDSTDNSHARTANGYTKARTGAIYPLDLNPDMIPIRLTQIIHDTVFRGPILEVEKIFRDEGLRNEITKRYGAHYTDGLNSYLKGIAGAEGIPSKAYHEASALSEFLRQNVISSYIGLNIYTALKHGPTALVLSAREVGVKNFAEQFLRSVTGLYGRSEEFGELNKKFVDQWSEEVGRRRRHWQDTIQGEHAYLYGKGTTRERIIEAGSWLVAQSDMLSVRPTWLAAYREAIEQGDTHGQAIELAERAVRRAHGSTAITNQPALVRGGGPLHGWLTSIYGFFGTVMQRRIELAHVLNDTYKLGRNEGVRRAAGNIPDILGRVIAHVLVPIAVEELVTGITTDDRRGWGSHILTGTLHGLGASILYLRDLMHAWTTGQDPGVGLLSSPLHDTAQLIRDLRRGERAVSPQYAGKTVGDAITTFGQVTGKAPKELGNLAHFGIDLMNEQAHPRTFEDWFQGLTRGTTKKHVVK